MLNLVKNVESQQKFKYSCKNLIQKKHFTCEGYPLTRNILKALDFLRKLSVICLCLQRTCELDIIVQIP